MCLVTVIYIDPCIVFLKSVDDELLVRFYRFAKLVHGFQTMSLCGPVGS